MYQSLRSWLLIFEDRVKFLKGDVKVGIIGVDFWYGVLLKSKSFHFLGTLNHDSAMGIHHNRGLCRQEAAFVFAGDHNQICFVFLIQKVTQSRNVCDSCLQIPRAQKLDHLNSIIFEELS